LSSRCWAPRIQQATPTGPVVLTTVVVLAIICGASLFKTLSLRAGGGVVARSLGGARIERNTRDPALRRLHNVVEEMAIASGVTMPEVYVLENEDGINAFAAGNSPADAAIAVTRGAATLLTRDELQGVVAHEFSHILNGDMRLNLRLLGWIFGLLVIAIVARIVLQSSPRTSSRDRRDGAGALMLAALAVMVLGYIGVFFGRLLQAAVSRHRERLADASAVQFTRNPLGLSGALLKIAGVSSGSRLNKPEVEEVAHMLFAAGMPRLFATHPSLEERLKALDPAFRTAETTGTGRGSRARCAAFPPGRRGAGRQRRRAPRLLWVWECTARHWRRWPVMRRSSPPRLEPSPPNRCATPSRPAPRSRRVCASSSTPPTTRACSPWPCWPAGIRRCSPRNARFSKTPMGRSSPRTCWHNAA
jgi:Zn-dependent protease with chaperone function